MATYIRKGAARAVGDGALAVLMAAGIGGWPDATLSIAIVLALPLLGALGHATLNKCSR
jgi:hypothetical protein